MRRSLALLAATLLSLTAIACGTSKTAHTASQRSPTAVTSAAASAPSPGGYSRNDGDADFDDTASYHGSPANDDLALLARYGPRAGRADSSAVASVVKRYYAASASGDGATACSLLAASLAEAVAAGQSQPGNGASGHTCAAAMSLLLSQQRERLREEDVATMTVIAVHVKGKLGLAVLGFRTAPESNIVLEREGRAWKIDALYGSELT